MATGKTKRSPRNPWLVLRRSKIHGRGVHARKDIPKGTRLIEYTGEHIGNAEADRRYEDDEMSRHHTFLFILNSRIAEDGDRDGLPNVLMEAAHQGLAIVSTRAAAIGEFIEDGDNGLLVPPGAPEALAAALARMIAHPDLRQQFARRAAETVRTRFSFDAGVDWIASALGQDILSEAKAAE